MKIIHHSLLGGIDVVSTPSGTCKTQQAIEAAREFGNVLIVGLYVHANESYLRQMGAAVGKVGSKEMLSDSEGRPLFWDIDALVRSPKTLDSIVDSIKARRVRYVILDEGGAMRTEHRANAVDSIKAACSKAGIKTTALDSNLHAAPGETELAPSEDDPADAVQVPRYVLVNATQPAKLIKTGVSFLQLAGSLNAARKGKQAVIVLAHTNKARAFAKRELRKLLNEEPCDLDAGEINRNARSYVGSSVRHARVTHPSDNACVLIDLSTHQKRSAFEQSSKRPPVLQPIVVLKNNKENRSHLRHAGREIGDEVTEAQAKRLLSEAGENVVVLKGSYKAYRGAK
jgi:hypothetical protein